MKTSFRPIFCVLQMFFCPRVARSVIILFAFFIVNVHQRGRRKKKGQKISMSLSVIFFQTEAIRLI